MHTYNCTKGHKPLELSHIPNTRMYTRIHMHSDAYKHKNTHTHNHIHRYTHTTHTGARYAEKERERERQKRSHSIICVLELIGSISLNSRIEYVMKGRTMSKVVYVRECPLYSVFWNVSIKCYILCTLVLHFIMHTRKKMRREKSQRHCWILISLATNSKEIQVVPCSSNVLLFNTNYFV